MYTVFNFVQYLQKEFTFSQPDKQLTTSCMPHVWKQFPTMSYRPLMGKKVVNFPRQDPMTHMGDTLLARTSVKQPLPWWKRVTNDRHLQSPIGLHFAGVRSFKRALKVRIQKADLFSEGRLSIPQWRCQGKTLGGTQGPLLEKEVANTLEGHFCARPFLG